MGLAHPAWYCLTIDEARSIGAAHAVEVFNERGAMHNDRGESGYLADLLLSEGRRLSAFGADDAHFKDERPDSFGAWVWVRAEHLEPDALLEALKTGAYYTSQGPPIYDIRIEDSQLVIQCSPARSIFVSGSGRRTPHIHGHQLTEWHCAHEPFLGSYCRITVVNAAGECAWSNPIWLNR